jgi:hypothetical protein
MKTPKKTPVWINMVLMRDGEWHPTWYEQWFGADSYHAAVAQRKQLQRAMMLNNSKNKRRTWNWHPENFKTIKIFV